MYYLHNKNKDFIKYFKFKGFDPLTGSPLFEEIPSRFSYKGEENILSVHAEKLLEKEQYKLIFDHFHPFTGLRMGNNAFIDVDWLLPYKDQLVYLSLHKNKWSNMDFIHTEKVGLFHKLKYLYLKESKCTDLSGLSALKDLIIEYADFKKYTFSALSHIQHFKFIYNKNIASIPLGASTPLECLSFMWDRDTCSFDFLAEVHTLKYISLREVSRLEEWTDASKMTGLKMVSFYNVNRFSDFRGLAKAPNLEMLNVCIRGLPARQLEPLQDCRSLKYLRYYNTQKDEKYAQEMFSHIGGINGEFPEPYNKTTFYFE